jgi:SNF2 family DNA or RNA helicase
VKTVKKVLDDANVEAVAVTGTPIVDESQDGNEKEQASREELLRRFREDEDVKVLVATIPSIGESVSLHKDCHHAIYLDRTFNCGLYMQSMDRIHRVGLKASDKTTYYLLETRGTIDEVIGQRLDIKMERMHRLLNDDIGILDLESSEEDLDSDFNEEDSLAIWKQLTSRRA